MNKHIKRMTGGVYYLPILSISWNNGLSLYVGWHKYSWVISTNKDSKPSKVLFPIRIIIKKLHLVSDLSGFNFIPCIHHNHKSTEIGFLFFSLAWMRV